MANDLVSFGAQMGDPESSAAILPHYQTLKRLLWQFLTRPYSDEIDEFALVLRVDGSLWHWDTEGPHRLRRSFKERYITIDVGVPVSKWKGRSARQIREFLMKNVELAFEKMVGRLKKDMAQIDENRLSKDLALVRSKYLQDIAE